MRVYKLFVFNENRCFVKRFGKKKLMNWRIFVIIWKNAHIKKKKKNTKHTNKQKQQTKTKTKQKNKQTNKNKTKQNKTKGASNGNV